MSTADQIIDCLTRYRQEGAITAKEIAEYTGTNPSTVKTALRRLQYLGTVQPLGEAFDGSRTWALTDEATR